MEAIIFSLLLMLSNTKLVLSSTNDQPINQNPQNTTIQEPEQGYTDDTMVECSSGGGKIVTVDLDGF